MASPFNPNATIKLEALSPSNTEVDSLGLPVNSKVELELKAYLKQKGSPQVVERNLVYQVEGYAVEPQQIPLSLRGAIGSVKFGSVEGKITFRQPLPSVAAPFTGDNILAEISVPL